MTLKEKRILTAYLKKLNDFHIAFKKEASDDDKDYWNIQESLLSCLENDQKEGVIKAKKQAHQRRLNLFSNDNIDAFNEYNYYGANNLIIINENGGHSGNNHHAHHSKFLHNEAHKIGKDIHKITNATTKVTHSVLKGIEHTGGALEHDICGGGGGCDCGEDCCKCCGGCCGISIGGGVMGGATAGSSTSSGSNGGGGNNVHNHHTTSAAQHGSHHGFFGNLQNNAEMIKHGHFFNSIIKFFEMPERLL
ncbi:MAG: hypothetical protein GY821_13035 [Gammaproteobacteria bacterium]|nr:hypothetical protein [Gammaproteobacteria bacterium]